MPVYHMAIHYYKQNNMERGWEVESVRREECCCYNGVSLTIALKEILKTDAE